MKYPVSLIILILIFFLAMNCDPNNPPKQLKPPKEKDKVTFAEALGYESLYMLIRKQNNCLDENWSKEMWLLVGQ